MAFYSSIDDLVYQCNNAQTVSSKFFFINWFSVTYWQSMASPSPNDYFDTKLGKIPAVIFRPSMSIQLSLYVRFQIFAACGCKSQFWQAFMCSIVNSGLNGYFEIKPAYTAHILLSIMFFFFIFLYFTASGREKSYFGCILLLNHQLLCRWSC